MTLDISTDYTIFDNAIEVTVSLTENGETRKVNIANGLRGPLTKQQEASLLSAGRFTGNEASWFIPDAQLNPSGNNREMKAGYTIDDRTDQWNVLSAREVSAGSSRSGWNCICQKHRKNDAG